MSDTNRIVVGVLHEEGAMGQIVYVDSLFEKEIKSRLSDSRHMLYEPLDTRIRKGIIGRAKMVSFDRYSFYEALAFADFLLRLDQFRPASYGVNDGWEFVGQLDSDPSSDDVEIRMIRMFNSATTTVICVGYKTCDVQAQDKEKGKPTSGGN